MMPSRSGLNHGWIIKELQDDRAGQIAEMAPASASLFSCLSGKFPFGRNFII
jgi:hypothetical protein